MKKSAMAIGLALMVFQAVQAPGRNTSTPAIHNDFLTVQWSAATHRFSLISKLGRPFMRDVALMATNGVARIVAVRGSRFTRFGDGRAIEVTGNGWRDRVMLFSGLPFALFQSAAIRPAASTPALIHSVRAFRGTVDVGKPATRLKTLGTGGLLAPAANPGSYVWLAVADPESRHGVVLGWITENRGSGVLFSGVKGDTVQICGRIDYGNLSLGPGSTPFETLAVGDFDDARLGLEAWADAVAREHDIHLPPEPVVYCTWYSRPYGAASDEKHFAQNVAFAVTNLGPYGFSVAQIDDHWQEGISTNGPHRDFLFSNPRGPYPHGMKATADAVKALGIRPGLWFEPFAGTYYDPFFKQHGDWFVRHTDGSPYEVKWGGTCLDMTDPGARDYVSNVVYRITHEWGFEYIKIDGLWTGTATPLRYVNTGYTNDGMGDAIFHVPNTPNVQAYRSGLKLVRAVAGTNVFILGCNGPQNMRSYGPAMGIVDAMRIGPDNKATWAAMLRGPTFGSRQYFLNGRVWYNDPDPVYPRDTVPLNEARALCSWVAISGAMNTSSEWYPGLSAARLDLLRRTIPAHHLLSTRPVDLFEHDPPRIWLLTDSRVTPHRNVIGLFNWAGHAEEIAVPLARLGFHETGPCDAFDYWGDRLLQPLKTSLKMSVPARSCLVLAVRRAANHPQLISTSRHITQGIVDVADERWDRTAKALFGRSRVVAGDSYELRIVSDRRAIAVAISPPGAVDAAKTSITQDGRLVRARIEPSVSGTIGWAVRFQ